MSARARPTATTLAWIPAEQKVCMSHEGVKWVDCGVSLPRCCYPGGRIIVRSELKTSPLSARHKDTVPHLIMSAQHTSTAAYKNTLGLILVVHSLTHTHKRACTPHNSGCVWWGNCRHSCWNQKWGCQGSDSESYRSAVAKLNKCVCACARVSVCPWNSTV